MNTEDTTPSGKKKFLIIPLVAIFIVAGVIGYRYYYDSGDTENPETVSTGAAGIPQLKEPTEAEKLLKSQVEALDKLRVVSQAQDTPWSTTTIRDQVKSLDALRAKQKTTATAAKKTLEQQIQAMDALRTPAN